MKPMPSHRAPQEMTAASRNIHQTIANGVNNKLGGFMNAESIHDIGAMHGNCVHAQVYSCSNSLVGFSIHNELQNFQFARRQSVIARAFKPTTLRKAGIKHRFPSSNFADGRS